MSKCLYYSELSIRDQEFVNDRFQEDDFDLGDFKGLNTDPEGKTLFVFDKGTFDIYLERNIKAEHWIDFVIEEVEFNGEEGLDVCPLSMICDFL